MQRKKRSLEDAKNEEEGASLSPAGFRLPTQSHQDFMATSQVSNLQHTNGSNPALLRMHLSAQEGDLKMNCLRQLLRAQSNLHR